MEVSLRLSDKDSLMIEVDLDHLREAIAVGELIEKRTPGLVRVINTRHIVSFSYTPEEG